MDSAWWSLVIGALGLNAANNQRGKGKGSGENERSFFDRVDSANKATINKTNFVGFPEVASAEGRGKNPNKAKVNTSSFFDQTGQKTITKILSSGKGIANIRTLLGI